MLVIWIMELADLKATQQQQNEKKNTHDNKQKLLIFENKSQIKRISIDFPL